jgi:hypothetical protein
VACQRQALSPASLEARRQTAQLLRELRGGLATTAAVGRRWLRNCLDNFLGIQRVLCAAPPPSPLPILIAASGPSLQAALPALGRLRERFALWALPSAVECLLAHGLIPDQVVLTDPGWYGLAHLFSLRTADTPLAMPLSAAPGAWTLRGGVQLLAQEALYEQALLAAAAYPAPIVPPGGQWRHRHGRPAAPGDHLRRAGSVLWTCWATPNLFESTWKAAPTACSPAPPAIHLGPALAPCLPQSAHRTGMETYAGWFASRAYPSCPFAFRWRCPVPALGPGRTQLCSRR